MRRDVSVPLTDVTGYCGFLKEKGTQGEGLGNGKGPHEVERPGDQEPAPREHSWAAGILSEEPLPFPGSLAPPHPSLKD